MAQHHKVCTTCGYTGKALFVVTKMGNVRCPKCNNATMVNLRSPEGQMVLNQEIGQPRAWADASEFVVMK